MRIAVVGGGIFGCVTAVELARAGERVELFERRADILLAASRCNQGRLHRGYHYPRAWDTAQKCKTESRRFAARYPEAIDRSHDHFYLLAREQSLTSSAAYLAFLAEMGLAYDAVDSHFVEPEGVALALEVPEALVDLNRLRELLREELAEAGVRVHIGAGFYGGGWDAIVDASYGHWLATTPRRYELCELALVELPKPFARRSIVVMDGPFVSIDPIPGTPYHQLYDVRHSVHAAHTAHLPDLPPNSRSVFGAMLRNARLFVKLPEVKYLRSRFTVRAVLPDVDATDERPTLVNVIFPGLLQIFPGKIDTALYAADEVLRNLAIRTPALC